ncbi:MAG TPA: hypothetical protein VK457_14510 [Chloroflexota bacterium]|nr:hypothetical protein [Chloroflexota bacterium]
MQLHLPRGLPYRQTHFLCILAQRPSLTRADYQRCARISHNTARKDLAELAAAGLVRPVGHARSRRYTLQPHLLVAGKCSASGAQVVCDGDHIRITIDPL